MQENHTQAPMTLSFGEFVESARMHPQIWRVILGIILIGLIWVAIGVAIMLFVLGGFGVPDQMVEEIVEGRTPFGINVLFATFSGLLIGTMVVARLLHGRSMLSVFGPGRQFITDFLRVLPIAVLIYGLFLAGWRMFFEPQAHLSFSVWLSVLFGSVAGVALQTLAEETAFRGYLMQQLAARFSAPLIWMGLPTVFFGLMHFDGSLSFTNSLLVVLATGTFGLVAADLTRHTGNLGAAWGLHFVNNFVAMFVLSTGDHLSGLALWKTPYGMQDHTTLSVMLALDIAMQLVLWRILVRFLAR